MTNKLLSIEAERQALIMQAIREHEENVTAELRRFHVEITHINTTCDLKTIEA